MMKPSSLVIQKRTLAGTIVRAENVNREANTIDVIFTTGSKGLQYDYDRNETYYEELEVTPQACDLSRLDSGTAPFLDQHYQATVATLGVVVRAWIENGVGMATIKFSSRAELQGIIQDIKDGILNNISVGYKVLLYQDITIKGERYRTLKAIKWLPVEISLVAIGFDPNARTVRSDDDKYEVQIIEQNGDQQMSIKTEDPQNPAPPVAVEPVVQDPQATPSLVVEPEPAAVVEPVQPDAEELKRAAVEEFKSRSLNIKSAVKAAGLGIDVAESLIERNLSMADASAEIFKILEDKSGKQTPQATVKEVKMEKRAMVLEALCKRAAPKKFKYSEENELKDKSLIEIFSYVVERKAGESDAKFAERAIKSTDLADILVNAANKVVNEYAEYNGTDYQKFTKPMTLRDFKEAPIVDLGIFELGAPDEEGDDYPEVGISDSKEKIQLRQRGALLVLTLVAIINDDLKMLEKLPDIAQNAGFRDLEKAVFAILNSNPVMSDTKALFHVDHKNMITDGTGVDVETMARAEQLLAEQTGLDGKELNLKPKFIIVSPKHALAARRLVGAQLSNDPEKFNPYAGSDLEVIVTNRITDKDSFFVTAHPEQMVAIVTGTLAGMDAPTVSSEEQFSSSSMRMKVEFHNNAAAANYQAIVRVKIV